MHANPGAVEETVVVTPLDRLTRLAAKLLDAPTAMVTLIEPASARFMAAVGLPVPLTVDSTVPVAATFCQFVVQRGAPLVVSDARLDPLVCDMASVRAMVVAAYLGVPLRDRAGTTIGSFCVTDTRPRAWTAEQQELLDDLAQGVMAELDNQRAYDALADATDSYRALLDSTTELVCAADGEGLVTYVNQAWCDAFGYTKTEALGRRALEFVTPEHRARYVDVARRLQLGERVDAFEVTAIGAGGRRVVCRGRATAHCVTDGDGRVVCLSTRAVYRDVTLERQHEAARAQLVATLEATSDFVGIASGDGRIEYINRAGRSLIGLDPQVDIAVVKAEHFHPPETLALLAAEGFPTALRDGVWRGDGELLTVDGVRIPVSIAMTAHPGLGPDHDTFFSAIMRDQRDAVAVTRALRTSEARFRAMFASAAIGVSVVSDAGIILEANRAFEEMLEYGVGELIGRYAPSLSPAEDAATTRAPVADIRAGTIESATVEKRFFTSGGATRLAQLTLSRLELEDGTIAILGLARDMTLQREAENALAAERAFLEATLDSLSDGVVACDAQGTLRLFNRATRELHGIGEQALAPGAWAKTYSLFRADGVTPLPVEEIPLFRALQGAVVREQEHVIAPATGEPRIVLSSGQALVDAQGQVQGAVVAMRDVTAQRRSELALQESETRYRRLLDLLPDGVMQQAGGVVHFVNAAMTRLVGAESPDDLVGRPTTELLHPDDRGASQARIAQATAPGSTDTGETVVLRRILRRDGSTVPCEVVGTTVQVQGITGTLAVVRDISDRLQQERALRENEERLALIFDHVSDVMFFMRVERTAAGRIADYRCESANAPLAAMTGRPVASYVGRALRDIVPPNRYDALRARYDDAVRSGSPQRFEYATDSINGPMVFETTLTPVRDATGLCTHVLGANRDVTARRAAEAALQQSEASFRTMLENVRTIALTLDTEGRLTFVNDALLSLTRWTRDEVLGTDWFARFTTDPEVLRRLFTRMISGESTIPHFESEIRTRDGRRRLIVWDNTVLHDHDGHIIGSASIGQDVTEQRAMEARLASLSERDELTGLYNRRGFVLRVEEGIQRSRRQTNRDALLYLDLDKFKPINDTYGHPAGDEALRDISALLQGAIRETDFAGRLGGDEFAIYASGLDSVEASTVLIERLETMLAEHNRRATAQGRPYELAFSLGIAWVEPDDTRDALFARADTALYAVKRKRT